jgi:CHAD domain-containing protein
VLVSPELATAVRSTPDTLIVGDNPPPPLTLAPELPAVEDYFTEGRNGSDDGFRGTVRYDTPDLLLERHGHVLELQGDGYRRTWRLTLARGEVVEEHAEDDRVPGRIGALLQALADAGDLRRVPVRSDDPEVRRLEERIVAQRESLLTHDAGARLAQDPENLHQLRVASRRLRVFLHTARNLVDATWAEEIRSPLRDLGRLSGEARDLDVLIDHVKDELGTLADADREPAAELVASLERDRAALQHGLLGFLDGAEYRGLLEQLGLPLETPAASLPAKTLEQLAARELRRLIARVRELGKAPSDEQLHALRIRVKRVRYAVELGGSLPHGARSERVLQAAARLQDILGSHHDAAVAEDRLRSQAYLIGSPRIAFAAGRLAERQRLRRAELHDRLPDAWRRLRRHVVHKP